MLPTITPAPVWICAVVALMVVAAGCNSGEPASTPIVPSDVVASTPATSDSPDNSGDDRHGGILVLDTADCGVFDPAIDLATNTLLPDLRLVQEIHAGLTRISEENGYIVEPELAETFRARDGSRRWDFQLRPNLKFSDGSPLLASHVKLSWERGIRKSTPPSRARQVLGTIAGAEQLWNGEAEGLSGVNIVDDRNLTVELVAPRADFPLLLTDPIASVLKPENVEDWDGVWRNHMTQPSDTFERASGPTTTMPVGAGPFRLTAYATPAQISESWEGDHACVLTRNDYYWDAKLPYLDGIIANARHGYLGPGDDATARQMTMLDDSSLDFAVLDPRSTADESQSSGSTTIVNPLTSWSHFLVFNPDVAPFGDERVRRALVLSIDRSRSANRFEDAPAFGLVPPSYYSSGDGTTQLPYDPVQALTLLDEAQDAMDSTDGVLAFAHPLGFAQPGLQVVFDTWNEALGLEVNVYIPEDDDVTGMADIRHTHASPTPAGALLRALNAFSETSPPSDFSRLRDQLDDALTELDDVDRSAQLRAIEQELIDRAFVLPILLVNSGRDLQVQPWVHDLRYPIFTDSVFRHVWFDETAPERQLPVP